MATKLIIFTAPSGAGKTTIVRHLLGKYDKLAFSVSATTRQKRAHEEHGKDYYFLTLEEWNAKIEADDFLEWEEVYTHQYYGTLKSEIERLRVEGKNVVFDIDVKGAMNIKAEYGEDAITIFVKPPSPDVLFQRLKARQTEDKASLRKRIARAAEELTYEVKCDIVLMNDDLKEALQNAEKIIEQIIFENERL
jgi:guanylate kinase